MTGPTPEEKYTERLRVRWPSISDERFWREVRVYMRRAIVAAAVHVTPECAPSPDGQHCDHWHDGDGCDHWHDGDGCCYCSAPGMTPEREASTGDG